MSVDEVREVVRSLLKDELTFEVVSECDGHMAPCECVMLVRLGNDVIHKVNIFTEYNDDYLSWGWAGRQ